MAIDFITLTELVNEAVDIILNDTAAGGSNDFCQTEYGKDLYIFSGLDLLKQPTEDDSPYVVVFRDDESVGEAVANYRYRLGFEVAVTDDRETTPDPRILKQLGEEKVEELAHLIYDVLRREMPCNANVDDMELSIDSSSYPMFVAGMVLGFNIPKPIGTSVPLGL